MDCFTPNLGHTAIRCTETSNSQARLLMLPSTIYLVGALLTLANWIRLALARRLFRFEHFLVITIYGLLAFALAAADLDHAVDERPYVSSRAIGVVSVSIPALLVVTVFNFLPPRAAIATWLDRIMVATASSALLCTLLASISAYTPDGLSYEVRNDFYAACACLLAFLLASLYASQNARCFALPAGPTGILHAFVSLGQTSNLLFVGALVALFAQTAIALVLPPHFALIMAASLFGALAYALFVATSIVAHFEPAMTSATERLYMARDREASKREHEFFHAEHDNTAAATAWTSQGGKAEEVEQSSIGHTMTPYHGERVAEVQPHTEAYRAALTSTDPEKQEQAAHGSERGSVIWNGGAAHRLRTQSGVSASSWDRLEHLMRARRDRGPLRSTATRPQSGLTYYGSDASYAADGLATRRASMLSSAGLAAAFGMSPIDVPPVPAIDPKYKQQQHTGHQQGRSDETLEVYAKPLTPGEMPIPLERPSATHISPPPKAARAEHRRRVTDMAASLWSNAVTGTTNVALKAKGNNEGSMDSRASRVSPLIVRTKRMRASESVDRSNDATLIHKPSADGSASLAARYNSSKLFPCPVFSDSTASFPGVSMATSPGPGQELVVTPWSAGDESGRQSNLPDSASHFAELQAHAMLRGPDSTMDTSVAPSIGTSVSKAAASKVISKQAMRGTIHEEDEDLYAPPPPVGVLAESNAPSSPRSVVEKETQQSDAIARDHALPSSAPVLPVKVDAQALSPTKVNRGKVVRKVDGEEHHSTKMASTLRFPPSPAR